MQLQHRRYMNYPAVDLTAADAQHLSIEAPTPVQHICFNSSLLDIDATRQPEHPDLIFYRAWDRPVEPKHMAIWVSGKH